MTIQENNKKHNKTLLSRAKSLFYEVPRKCRASPRNSLLTPAEQVFYSDSDPWPSKTLRFLEWGVMAPMGKLIACLGAQVIKAFRNGHQRSVRSVCFNIFQRKKDILSLMVRKYLFR